MERRASFFGTIFFAASKGERKNRGETDREKMKVHGGKELVTMRTESPIHVRASSFPLGFVFARAHHQTSRVCTYELVHAFVFYGGTRVYLHTRPDSSTSASPIARSFARVRVSRTRKRFSGDEPRVETRATIFEPGKERSRINFLHNFGSPRRF